MSIATQLVRLTGRLRAAATQSGAAVKNQVVGVANDFRKIADNVLVLDKDGAAIIGRSAPDMPRIVGVSSLTLRRVTFRPDQVRSLAVLGPGDKPVGVRFPSQLRDAKAPTTISSDVLDKLHREVGTATLSESGDRRWKYGKEIPPTWGDGDLVLTMGHSTENEYAVQVRKKIPFTRWSYWSPTLLDGENFATVVAADRYFKQAVREAPTAELIQAFCSTSSGSAARTFSRSLSSHGIHFDVHAPEKLHLSHYDDYPGGDHPAPGRIKQIGGKLRGHSVEVEIDESGNIVSQPWAVHKASLGPPPPPPPPPPPLPPPPPPPPPAHSD